MNECIISEVPTKVKLDMYITIHCFSGSTLSKHVSVSVDLNKINPTYLSYLEGQQAVSEAKAAGTLMSPDVNGIFKVICLYEQKNPREFCCLPYKAQTEFSITNINS